MEKLNVGVWNGLAVGGINNRHVNDEIDAGLGLTYIVANQLARDVCNGLAV